MKCYRHPSLDAVGVCKNCNKGMCADCAADIGNGIACKNACEEAVKDINALISRNKKLQNKSSRSYYLSAVINVLLGIFFILYPFLIDPQLTSLFVPMGAIFLLAALFTIYSAWTLQAKK